jgi:hypothetical protein
MVGAEVHGNLKGVKPSFALDPIRLVSVVLNLRVWNPAPYFPRSSTTRFTPSSQFLLLLACDHLSTTRLTHHWPARTLRTPTVGHNFRAWGSAVWPHLAFLVILGPARVALPRQWLWPRVSGSQSFWPPGLLLGLVAFLHDAPNPNCRSCHIPPVNKRRLCALC